MKDERETPKDVGTPAAIERWLAAVAAGVAVLLVSPLGPSAASPEICLQFHQECAEARAAGYRDVGICNVERLECPIHRDARLPKPSHEVRNDDRNDPERSLGERSLGP